MATLAEHTKARNDEDIRPRIKAAAEELGIQQADMWMEQNIGTLISTKIADGQAISDILTFAYGQKGLPAGADPAFVTDEHLRQAVQATLDKTNITPVSNEQEAV